MSPLLPIVALATGAFAFANAAGANDPPVDGALPAATRTLVVNPRVAHAVEAIRAGNGNRDSAFLVIDKVAAELYVFEADGALTGAAPVLLGSARGDQSAPDIGTRALQDVAPHERTTPAGRFEGELGRNARSEDVVWVDYDAAISIHRVLTSNPRERRMERLRSATPDDNRISHGCINVMPAFYEGRIQPLFRGRRSPIYVLPEADPATTFIPGQAPSPRG